LTRLAAAVSVISDIRIVETPRELPELAIYAVWHPRLQDDPGHITDSVTPLGQRRPRVIQVF